MSTSPHPLLKTVKVILFCVTCLLGYLLWSELNRPLASLVNHDIGNRTITTTSISSRKMLDTNSEITDYDEIINRPLFFEDRKPYVYIEPETPTKKPKPKKPNAPKKTEEYTLSAIIITPERQLAIIQSGREKSLQRLALGESINGWTVEAIEPRSVSLIKDNEKQLLELEVRTSKTPQQSTTKTSAKPIQEELIKKVDESPEKPNLNLATPNT